MSSKNAELAAILRGKEGQEVAQALQQQTTRHQEVSRGRLGQHAPTPTYEAQAKQPYTGWERGRSLGEKKAIRPPPAKEVAQQQAQARPAAEQNASQAARNAQQLRSQQPQAQPKQKDREPSR